MSASKSSVIMELLPPVEVVPSDLVRAMAVAVFKEAIEQGELRAEVDPETAIDLLYAPLYYRLQIGTGPLSQAYIEGLFDHRMRGLRNKPASR